MMNLTRDERRYWNRVLAEWQDYQECHHPYKNNKVWQKIHRQLKEWLQGIQVHGSFVLEIGCGTGLLQNVTPRHIGIDIAHTSSIYMRKPFITACAMSLPFKDDSFDAAFSVWVLEHVNFPEAMLVELRRVVKPGGSIFLAASYSIKPWINEGIRVRPFKDLSLSQCWTKLTLPFRSFFLSRLITSLPSRLIQLVTYLLRRNPTSLPFSRLQANYAHYWNYDADACASIDAYDVVLFFLSRSDTPHYPGGMFRSLIVGENPQVYIINKSAST